MTRKLNGYLKWGVGTIGLALTIFVVWRASIAKSAVLEKTVDDNVIKIAVVRRKADENEKSIIRFEGKIDNLQKGQREIKDLLKK